MRPILFGDQNSALFAHQNVSNHLPIILDLLSRTKVVSELDLSDNSLTTSVVQPLVDFVNESDQLSLLHLDDNPMIGDIAMRTLLEGIKDCRSLESLSISNTGCSLIVGRAIAQLLAGCIGLLKLNISHCSLRQAGIEVSVALPLSSTLRRVNLSQNELFYGQRKLALSLGTNAAKCSTLSRLDVSQNALPSEMAITLLRGLGDAPNLHRLDLSRNNIDEPAGRAIAMFIQKSSSIRKLDISHNPILNVTRNKEIGQKKLEEDAQKPGGGNKKDKKPKAYVPAGYLMLTALGKSVNMKEMRMVGLVADWAEWGQRMETLGDKVTVVFQAADAGAFNFRPKTATPVSGQPVAGVKKGAAPATAPTGKRKK
jgi:Ran GTPase-activating protein (RanGAP) involved in mRNA processing and transport